MTNEIGIHASGFLFLYILASQFAMAALGYRAELGDCDPDAELQRIGRAPNRFRASIGIALIEHASIIALAILLLIAFGSFSLILGVVWTIFRVGEGLVVFYIEKDYWGLVKMARKYSVASDAEKKLLGKLALGVLRARESRFQIGMGVFWSVGTLAFSILLVAYGIAPLVIGCLGIVASIIVSFCNWAKRTKHDYKVMLGIGALLAISFEISIGVWLITY